MEAVSNEAWKLNGEPQNGGFRREKELADQSEHRGHDQLQRIQKRLGYETRYRLNPLWTSPSPENNSESVRSAHFSKRQPAKCGTRFGATFDSPASIVSKRIPLEQPLRVWPVLLWSSRDVHVPIRLCECGGGRPSNQARVDSQIRKNKPILCTW